MRNPTVLRDNRDFQSIYKKGKSVADRYVVVFYKANSLPYNRTAFVASKKVGGAVARNRARRLMKEAYRTMTSKPTGYDLILVARNTIANQKSGAVAKSLAKAFGKAKLTTIETK